MRRPGTYGIQLSLLVQIPDVLAPIRNLIAQRLPHRGTHIIVPRRQDDNICRDLSLILVVQDQCVWLEPGDTVRALSDLDLPVSNELAAPDVDVVPATAGVVETANSRPVDAVVDFKACLFKSR